MPKSKLISKRHLRRKVRNDVELTKRLILHSSPTLPSPYSTNTCTTSNSSEVQINTLVDSNESHINLKDSNSFNSQLNIIHDNNGNVSVTQTTDNMYIFDEFCNESETIAKKQVLEEKADINNNLLFLKKLKSWVCRNNVTHKCLNELLQLIRPKFPFLKNDARSILGTPRSVEKYTLNNGDLIYLGLEKGLRNRIDEGFEHKLIENEPIPLQINIDGIPLFNNGVGQFWPILVRSVVFKNKTPFSVAIFFGSGKPDSLALYLKSFIEECSLLLLHGFEYLNQVYQIKLLFFTCDAPARAYLKQVMGHTSKAGCERCVIKSEYKDTKHFYPVNTYAESREDDDFIGDIDANRYIKEKSPLLKLNVKLISEFVLDPMHLIYLGSMKRLLKYWVEGKRPFKLHQTAIININKQLAIIKKHTADDFPRKIRTLSFIKYWKATEYRFFLLYCGFVVLKDYLNDANYKHFLLLHCAAFILSNKRLTNSYLEVARSALTDFVNISPDVYDCYFVVYNIHSLTHVCDDVSRYGSLDDYSCFVFENYLGQLKRKVRGKYLPLQQIFNRLNEIEKSAPRKNLTTNIKSFGAFNINHNYCQFKKLELNNFVIAVDEKNNTVAYLNKIHKIRSILFIDGIYKCVANTFKYLEDCYHYPIESSKLGIF